MIARRIIQGDGGVTTAVWIATCLGLLLLVGGVAEVSAQSPVISNLAQVTTGNFVKLYPDISPDGKRLVYQAYNPRAYGKMNYDIYLIDLISGRRPVRITTEASSDENPAWMGGGNKILFDALRIDTRGVWIKDVSGAGALAQVSRGKTVDFDADSSPDSKRVAFCSLEKGKDIKSPKDGEDRVKLFKNPEKLPKIWLINADGTAMTDLIKGINPAWSPDGQTLAFSSNITGNYEIYRINADGSGLMQLTSFEEPDIEPAWSPDGRYLAFTSFRGKNWNLWMMRPDGGQLTQLTIHKAYDGAPSWGPDGTIYFHSDRSGDWDIWRFKPTGYEVRPPEPEPEPVVDTDGDGFNDDVDLCVNDPEDHDGYQDEDGCPDPDNDGDNIPDVDDLAPMVPETYNGYRDTDGIPDEPPIPEKMILTGLLFASGKAEIKPTSYPVIDDLAAKLRDDINAHIEIRGFTDSLGSDRKNLDLSQKRAEAVRDLLIQKGIAPERLTAVGYGEAFPVADNKTLEGRTLNRRIEIVRIVSNPKK